MFSLDLEEQLRFYGAYHHNSVNVVIHIICVPLILMTSLLLASNTPNLALPSYLPNVPINLGTFVAFVYCSIYVLMEPVAGALVTPLIMGGTIYSDTLLKTYGNDANYWAIGIHVASWIAQFVGHGKFEGRAPALLDNLVQAFLLAPFFVWMECLFMCGYRPELRARLDKGIQQEIARFKMERAVEGLKNGNGNGKTNGKAA